MFLVLPTLNSPFAESETMFFSKANFLRSIIGDNAMGVVRIKASNIVLTAVAFFAQQHGAQLIQSFFHGWL